MKNFKVKNAISVLIQTIYFYSIFYLIVLLFTNIDIFIKLVAIVIVLFLLLILKENMVSIIDFISSTNQIFVLSFMSVIIGLLISQIFINIIDYVILNSDYLKNIDDTLENTSIFLIFLIFIWFYFSYNFFKISIRYIEKLEIKKIRIIVLTKQHFKVLEAGTVFSGFMSLLVSIIIKAELNSIINNFILGFYLLCLIPFLYFHFNEDLYNRRDLD
ncbi:hypothetical protein LG296_15145 [Ureibacillus chungkukjangi]|uniref:hypothetical protein n=1 Tax=Ureibacillus chungkukjangi TaxID=1202712 RepID=UPI00384D08C1